LFGTHHISQCGVAVVWIRIAVGTEVREKDLQMFAKPLRSVSKLGFNGIELNQSLEGPVVELVSRHVSFVQGRVHQYLCGVPVIGHLVIVPLDKNWGLRKEALHLVVTMVVLPVGPKLVKSNSNEVLGGIVHPSAEYLSAVGVIDCSGNGTISINQVSLEKSKIR